MIAYAVELFIVIVVVAYENIHSTKCTTRFARGWTNLVCMYKVHQSAFPEAAF